MPKDIYMPALGMSQNTGVIAEWHKEQGDPVAVGDVLMSVETDKAVQEIEATDAGFMGRILHPAGAEVPVGEVIASIVADASEAGGGDSGETPAATPVAPASSGKDIYMPALGMSQNTGVIAEWHKKPGDPVAVGDVLMSVETDKAVQEIEATNAGFMGRILHPAGAEVPVGEVIASIVADASEAGSGDSGEAPTATPVAPAASKTTAKPTAPPAATPRSNAPSPRPSTGGAPANSRPLASPKARRLARERGLDLAAIWEQCGFRPVLAADVENNQGTAAAVSANTTSTASAGSPVATSLSVSVSPTHLLAFVDWLGEQTSEPASVGIVAARFMAGVWRRHVAGESAISVDLVGYAQRSWSRQRFHEVDQGGLLSLWQKTAEPTADTPATLMVVDFTRSTIRSASTQAINGSGCILTFDSAARDTLSLTVVSPTLSMEALAPITSELADLLEQPLNALLL